MLRTSRWVLGSLGVAAVGLAFIVAGVSPIGVNPAAAAPVTSADVFSLAAINDTQTVFSSGSLTNVGVSVAVSSGEASVEGFNGSWSGLGVVMPNQSETFEGNFTQVRVKALAASTAGSYSDRNPTDVASVDHLVGAGTITIGASAVRVFANSGGPTRHILISGGSANVTLRTSSGGGDLETVYAGDGAYYCQAGVTEYWIAGSGTVSYKIYDNFSVVDGDNVPTTYSATTTTKKRVFTGDGTECFIVHLTNSSSTAATIHYKYKANTGAETDITLAGNSSTDITCKLEFIEITDGTVAVTTKKA